jgi:hypothetical protein
MHELVPYLIKRRKMMMGAVVFLAVAAIAISFNFHITASTHFGGKYNRLFIYFLIMYKLIELPILYYLLLHRHLVALRKDADHPDRLGKLRKHSKLLLFLIPQGNTIFGIIAFKLSGNVLYFLLFSCIAIITLYLIKPNKFKLY